MVSTPVRRTGVGVVVIAFLSFLALFLSISGIRVDGLPFLYPMRPTAAVGLLSFAFAMAAASRGSRTAARVASLAVVLLAISALVAQTIRWMQVIDESPASSLAAVVMAIHTALPNSLCLIGLGTASYVLLRRSRPVYVIATSAIAAVITVAFALCSLLNELTQLLPASPAFEGEIAVDAAIGFALAGVLLWRFALAGKPQGMNLRRPVTVAIAGTVLSFLVWRTLLHERTDVVADQTASMAVSVVHALRSRPTTDKDGVEAHPPSDASLKALIPAAVSVLLGSHYQLFFVRNGQIACQVPQPPIRYEGSTVAEMHLPELGGTVRVHPGSQFVRRGASWASHLVLAFGFTSSLFLAVSMYLVQTGQERVAQVEREIIERRRVENELQHKARLLTESNADLEDFARAISHDLQEPLRSLTGFADLLARRYGGQLDSDGNEFLSYITDAAQRMSGMIRGILAYSRAVHLPDASERVDLNEAVSWATENLALAIEESGATVDVSDLPTIEGNSIQLAQVFQNLLSNAIKYRPPNGRPVIRVRCSHHPGEHRIEISDNGIGIPESSQETIFGLFRRAHGKEYSGTGVGLAICKRIVERHGGTIWVESKPGVGSTFFISLPDVAE